jgi:uncharacterized protein YndB with AHSA1/START domain
MDKDSIEREIEIDAPIDRVWTVLTQPEHVATWFGTGAPIDIDLRPGGIMTLDHGDHGRYRTRFVEVSPPHVLSYRWAAGFPDQLPDESNSTLVEFTLVATATGTTLRVVESGFASFEMPADRERAAGFDNHSDGWIEVLARAAGLSEGKHVEPLAGRV